MVGIAEILIIRIASTDSIYSGKNISIKIGKTIIPKAAIPIENKTVIFFSPVFVTPDASCGIMYFNTSSDGIISTVNASNANA